MLVLLLVVRDLLLQQQLLANVLGASVAPPRWLSAADLVGRTRSLAEEGALRREREGPAHVRELTSSRTRSIHSRRLKSHPRVYALIHFIYKIENCI